MKPEQELYRWLSKVLIHCDVQRIENAVSSGVPDCNICRAGVEIWVELKVVTNGHTILRKEQHAWAMRRSGSGGRTFVISWHKQADTLFFYRYPTVLVAPWQKTNKYVITVSDPQLYIPRHGSNDRIISFLFSQ